MSVGRGLSLLVVAVLAVAVRASAVRTYDVEASLADLAAFTGDSSGDAGIAAAVKEAFSSKAPSIKEKINYKGQISNGGVIHDVKYFRIGTAVHFYVYGKDAGQPDLTHRLYMQLPNTDQVFFVPKKCELIKDLKKEPPVLKKCKTAKLVADSINKMIAESTARGGKSLQEGQQVANQIVDCIKSHVDVAEVGIQCLEEGVQMSPAWYQEQLLEQAQLLRAQGKTVTIKDSKLVVSA